jgi:predicted dehydrogenase
VLRAGTKLSCALIPKGWRTILLLVTLSLLVVVLVIPLGVAGQTKESEETAMREIRLITLDPGHFHAALIQKEMYPNVSKRVVVYAPFGGDLIEHLNRVARFNTRKANPTNWEIEIHAGPNFLERMLEERPGNVVVISGRNRGKIDRIKQSVETGLNVLADKPWIIDAADFPKLEATLDIAADRGVVAYDLMTSRFEITSILQRELVNDADTFGAISIGTEQEPAVYVESVHHLLKIVAGVPNLRPAWFFDVEQQGEGLADVGTHLVDRVQWTLFPEQEIDYRKDLKVGAARHWPTVITRGQFQRVTGEVEFPSYLSANVTGDELNYFCNTVVSYTVRGVHTKLNVVWRYEAPAGGGDTAIAIFRGTRSRVEVRQGAEQKFQAELYVVPNSAKDKPAVQASLAKKIESLQRTFPGLAIEDRAEDLRVIVPSKYRDGHEANFAEVTSRFLKYVEQPKLLPAWEKANMLAKYYVTTKGVALSRQMHGTGH